MSMPVTLSREVLTQIALDRLGEIGATNKGEMVDTGLIDLFATKLGQGYVVMARDLGPGIHFMALRPFKPSG